MAVRVTIEPAPEDKSKFEAFSEPVDFYFHDSLNVLQCKSEICDHFGITEAADISKYTLFRVDDFGVARWPVRKEKKDLGANAVSSGDSLIFKNDVQKKLEETLTLSLHRTMTGLPEHCEYVGTIDVSRELKLSALKEALLEHMDL